MRTLLLLLVLGVGLVALTVAPTTAEHNALVGAGSAEPAAAERNSLDVDLKFGLNGFRLGARIFGEQGYRGGAWLNGETRPEGFSVDGRVEREGGKAWNFKLNADIDAMLRRAAAWWGVLHEP